MSNPSFVSAVMFVYTRVATYIALPTAATATERPKGVYPSQACLTN